MARSWRCPTGIGAARHANRLRSEEATATLNSAGAMSRGEPGVVEHPRYPNVVLDIVVFLPLSHNTYGFVVVHHWGGVRRSGSELLGRPTG